MSTKRGHWADKKTKRSSTPYGRPEYKRNSYNMYKSPRLIMPQEYVTTLRYSVFGALGAVAGVTSRLAFKDDCYDVDPLLASTAMPGFTELAAFYARYRPLRMTADVDFTNMEAFPQTAMLLLSNSSGVTLSINDLGNPFCVHKQVGHAGGQDTCRLHVSASKVQIAGTKQPLYDDLYTGSTASATLATAGTTNLYVGYTSGIAGTLAIGMVATIRIAITVQFYRPALLTA